VTTRIQVRAERDYEVVVGTDLGDELLPLIGDQVRRVLLMHAAPLGAAAATLTQRLEAVGYQVIAIEVPDGEDAKTAELLTRCWDTLGAAAFGREDVIVGMGGGATTDLAGFVAATWLRGVHVIQIPTTLLAMVDAAVGGKTGINTAAGKNLVGAFHSPSSVLCDLATLRTLPRPDLVAGLAEVIKCGFIADPEILRIVDRATAAVTDPSSAELAELVRRAIQVKADVVAADLRESHLREILNYGHTFGHAIEHTEHYRWRHGEAVSVGMVYVAELARLAGRLGADVVAQHRDLLGRVGLPLGYQGGRWPELHEAMRRDKKTRGDRLRFVVLDGVAEPARLEGPEPELLVEAYAAITLG